MKSLKLKYTIIGMGQFGKYLCLELSNRNNFVIAVGGPDESLEDIQDQVNYAMTLKDFTQASLNDLDFDQDSVVIVSIGGSFETNLLVAFYLQQMGVKQLYVRAVNDAHQRILQQMNIRFINLAQITAFQFASQLQSPRFLRAAPMDAEHTIAEMELPSVWIGHKLRDVELRTKFKLNLLTIRRGFDLATENIIDLPLASVIGTPDPDEEFQEKDILVLFGREDKLIQFADFISEDQTLPPQT